MASSDPKPEEIRSKSKRKQSHVHPEEGREREEISSVQKKIKLNGTWANLDLILSLQSKDLHLQRKIDLAFDFVVAEADRTHQGPEPISFSRLVSFLGDWIQRDLFSSKHSKESSGLLDPCLDYRCWAVLAFCLEKSFVGVYPNLLCLITQVFKQAVLVLNGDDTLPVQECSRLFQRVLDCLSLLFSSNARAFYNVRVELWISCVVEVVDVVRRISVSAECGCSNAEVLLRLSGLLLEHFATFLRFYPNPKNISHVFEEFVNELLQPLLELLVLLHLRDKDSKIGQVGSLLRMVEGVLSNGLFHRVHIEGLLSSRSLNANQEGRESRVICESYHKHFFRKVEEIIAGKKAMVLGGLGYLLQLFISRAKIQKGGSMSSKGNHTLRKSSKVSEEAQETGKSLFNVFVQFMKPLLLECRRYAEKEFSNIEEVSEDRLLESHCILKSVNKTLASCIQEKIYVRTEGTSGEANYNFLKEVSDTVICISEKVYLLWLSALHMDDSRVNKILPLIARELVVAVHHCLEIEYKAIGDDLTKLWLMLLSYLAACMSLTDTKPSSLLTIDILNLGVKLIDVYSDLRQVHTPLFALCKALRLFGDSGDVDAVGYSIFISSLISSKTYLKSAATLLCSQELRLTISNAIKSIPEGQTSGSIQQLNKDINDSLEWIRCCSLRADRKHSNGANSQTISILDLDTQNEFLGALLSEIYTIVLDSVTVTGTNSTLVENSIKNLLETIRPSFSNLVNQSGCVDEFIYSVTGRRLSNYEMSEQDGELRTTPLSISWIFVFFFRMYISCRSLYRQSISLMRPDLARKSSESMGSLFTASCGMDWIERPDFMDEGYFSWIVTPSISLPNVIKFFSEDVLSSGFSSCAPLVYAVHTMALQRLSDLNRMIKAFEFLQERDALDSAYANKSSKKWKQIISVSKQEAAELTTFMTGHLQIWDSKGQHIYGHSDETGSSHPAQEDSWDLVVCSLNEKSLPVAIWWLLCQNTDLWCAHATKNYLKKFLSCLLLYSLPCGSMVSSVREHKTTGCFSGEVTMHHIILEYLGNTISYEQTFLCKHLISRFCCVLKKSLPSILSHACASHIDLGSLPDWSEILKVLEKGPKVDLDGKLGAGDYSSLSGTEFVLPNMQYLENSESQSFSSFSLELITCESLLSLLSKMPMVHLTVKSFSLYATYLLNLERLVISNLLHDCGESFTCNPFQLLRLLISCRRAMKYLVMESVKENSGAIYSFSFPRVSDGGSYILWLLKSVSRIVELPHAIFGEEHSSQVHDMVFSLIEHTSYIVLAITEGHMNATMAFLKNDEKLHNELVDKEPSKQHPLIEADQQYHSFEYFKKYVEFMAETFEEQTKNLLVSLRSCLNAIKLEARDSVLNWNKLSSTISNFQGFIGGLTSALDSIHEDYATGSPQSSSFTLVCVSRLSNCIAVFDDFLNLCLSIFVIDDCQVAEVSMHHSKVVHDIDLSKLQGLKGSLLQSLLKGECPQMSFALKQLFIASAAILKIKFMLPFPVGSKFHHSQLASRNIAVLLGTAQLVLLEMAKMNGMPDQFSFIWLDGVLTFFEVVGSIFADLNIAQLIDTHLRAIGKCISLQGKAATLSSHETGSNTKMLQSQNGSIGNGVLFSDYGRYSINAFKTRLRMSFKRLIRSAPKLHLKTVLQALERALVGVQQGCNMVYKINTGNADGGKVTSIVAAGIDCLELVLESFSGRKRALEKNIWSLVSALLNIVLHLQNPSIFYLEKLPRYNSEVDPDAGSVILMCVEVLTKVVGNHSFQMDPCYISQCLHIPLALFCGFHQLTDASVFSGNQESRPLTDLHHHIVDRQFSVELYASCCKLLCTTLRHHKSEVKRCIALLEESVRTLLSCLEMVGAELVKGRGYFAWDIKEAVTCASFLRRIYEEIRQQKDVFRKHSSYFLSSYICTYSGYGALKAGIKREIDEALRPGVYSLIDICTEADLQQLHSSLGEGPCRSTLKTLLHDYKLNFHYEGKI